MVNVRLARKAMAARFELVLQGEDEVWLRAAGEEALSEIERLEARLTIFRPTSEVSRINANAAKRPVRVEPRLFRLLQTAKRLHRETAGAFDLTVAPLMKAWGFFRDTGRLPDEATLADALRRTGMQHVVLDEDARTVRFERDGVSLDFGAIGKGFAIDEAVVLLKEAGVERAFLHGGTSTMYALGTPIDEPQWRIAVPRPGAVIETNDSAVDDVVLAIVPLENESLSVSAVWGKAFEADGKTYGHVLDPRLGRPVDGAVLAAVACESATISDALSTAFLVNGTATTTYPGRVKALLVMPPGADSHYEVIEAGLQTIASERTIVTAIDS